MAPYIHIFGKEIGSYWFMSVIGICFVIGVGFWRCRKKKLDLNDQLYFVTFCMMGMLIGAKVLAWLTSIPYIIENLSVIFASYDSFMQFLGTGFVFYGGLFGVVGGCIVYAWFFKVNVIPHMQASVICIPVFHFWGRIGCFLAGCCYGIESENWGIAYTNALWSPNGIKFLPVQLIEAFGNIVILIIILAYERKPHRELENMGIYFISYGVMRFILEFFRGDAARGHFLMFSTSQWISFIALAVGAYLVWGKERKLLKYFRGSRKGMACGIE